jgi:dTDP-4-dehydrorhamnose reductase
MSEQIKILVTGANGQLGNELKVLSKTEPGFQFIFTDIAELDITSEEAVTAFFLHAKPDAVINCAAYTAVDKAEQETEKANLINAVAVGILARAASVHNAIMVHISTDYVFDGQGHRPYREDDPLNPVSAYARSKYNGETEMLKHAMNGYIIRTSWLYSSFGANFVKTIMKYGKERGLLNVVFDQIGTPTYARDLAVVILAVIKSGRVPEKTEIYHFSDEGVISWYDFAISIVELTGIKCKINPIETKDYPLPAMRPFYSVFNKAKIKQQFGIEIPYWRDSLKDCIDKMNIEP